MLWLRALYVFPYVGTLIARWNTWSYMCQPLPCPDPMKAGWLACQLTLVDRQVEEMVVRTKYETKLFKKAIACTRKGHPRTRTYSLDKVGAHSTSIQPSIDHAWPNMLIRVFWLATYVKIEQLPAARAD